MRWGSGVLMNLYTLKNLSVRSYNSDFCCFNANLRCPIRYGLLVHQDGVIFFQFWLKLTLRFICNLIKFLMSCECLIKMGLLIITYVSNEATQRWHLSLFFNLKSGNFTSLVKFLKANCLTDNFDDFDHPNDLAKQINLMTLRIWWSWWIW